MQLRSLRFGAVDWRVVAFIALSALGLVVLAWAASNALGSTLGFGFDARAYWGYPRDEVYSAGPAVSQGYGFYRYSPVFVPLMTVWTAIPWPVFVSLWFAIGIALYVWMVGPWALALLAVPVFAVELFIGNVHLLLALAIVLGFRWPAAWSFVLLTKVTPGVGLLWFAVRREWRSLAIALGATAVIAAVSLVLMPGLWSDWVRSLTQTSEPGSANTVAIPLYFRVAVAALLVTWGARTDRRWTVVVAATISIPVLWLNGLAMLAGVVALRRGFPEQLAGQLDWLTDLVRGRPIPAARPPGALSLTTVDSIAALRAHRWTPSVILGFRVLLSTVAIAFLWVVLANIAAHPNDIGYDAHAYWGYPREQLYAEPGSSVAGLYLYRYSPAFVPVMTLFTALPWPVFLACWVVGLFLVYLWLVGPWWLPVLAFAPIVMELRMANVHILLAAAIVLGFRWPAAWSFVLLTKVTPGVGLLWFAVRREWRSLAIALGATAVFTGISFVLAPSYWMDWLVSLARTSQDDPPMSVAIPLSWRLVAAAALVVWGARTDRRWTVVVAATLALPTLWFHGFAMLAGVVALQRGLPEARSFDWLARWLPGRVLAAPSQDRARA